MSAGYLWVRYSAKGILDFLLPANIFIVLLCLFSIVTNIPSDSWTGGHGKGFLGFFGHQNLLASVLLFTLPAVFSKLWQPVNGKQLIVNSKEIKVKSLLTTYYLLLIRPWRDLAFGGLLTTNLLLLTLTYSRSAILSFLFGAIVFLLLDKKWKIISYSFIIAAVLAIVIYLTPSSNQFADKIIKKDFPEFYSSRMWMWEPSYKAALEGGLFGLGYGISHPDIRSGEYSDRFENGRLIREKGNSSLALIEEAGLIGLALFLLPLIVMIANYNRVPPTPHSLLSTSHFLLAAIYAFLLHSQFEAWWIGVGSVQMPLFFMYFGLLYSSINISNKKLDN
jgi:O-antigen ligase